MFLARPEPPQIAAAPPTEAFLEPAMGTPFIFSPSETGGGGGKDSEVVVGEEAVLVLRDTDLQVFISNVVNFMQNFVYFVLLGWFLLYLEAVVEEPDEEWS